MYTLQIISQKLRTSSKPPVRDLYTVGGIPKNEFWEYVAKEDNMRVFVVEHKKLNAAALYYLAKGLPFADGFKRAMEVLEERKPVELVSRYVKLTKGAK